MDINIYIADLEAYNGSKLRGAWADATDWDDIEKTVKKISKDGAVEVMIHDSEGYNFGETSDFEAVHALACAIEEHGEAYLVYVGIVGDHYATLEDFQDKYLGTYSDKEAWIESILEDYTIPEEIEFYIDKELMADQYLRHHYNGGEGPSGDLHIFSQQ